MALELISVLVLLLLRVRAIWQMSKSITLFFLGITVSLREARRGCRKYAGAHAYGNMNRDDER